MIIIDCAVVAVLILVALFVYAETRTNSPGGPQTPTSYAIQGITAFKSGNLPLAESLFKKEIAAAGSVKSKEGLGYYNLGTVAVRLQGVNQGIKDYQTAISLSPRFPVAWMTLAITEASIHNTTLALEDYNSVLAFDPNLPQGLFNSGVILYDQGSKAEGIARIDKAIQLQPTLSSQLPKNINLS
jgi:tetratricopeptide (TPR) repeat protein